MKNHISDLQIFCTWVRPHNLYNCLQICGSGILIKCDAPKYGKVLYAGFSLCGQFVYDSLLHDPWWSSQNCIIMWLSHLYHPTHTYFSSVYFIQAEKFCRVIHVCSDLDTFSIFSANTGILAKALDLMFPSFRLICGKTRQVPRISRPPSSLQAVYCFSRNLPSFKR